MQKSAQEIMFGVVGVSWNPLFQAFVTDFIDITCNTNDRIGYFSSTMSTGYVWKSISHRLAQVHSLDQSTIRVIQDPIRCFLNRDPQADGKNSSQLQNDTEPTMWGTIFHQADISAGARRIDLGKSNFTELTGHFCPRYVLFLL